MPSLNRSASRRVLNVWPGWVDALSTLVMVIIFVLLVFVISQTYLSATLSGREECARLDAAETWLASNASKWQRRLAHEPGYEPPDAPPKVCALGEGHPYSDQQRLRIYVRGWHSADERVTLAHEYLHLAFRFHPSGADEEYIERLARKLIEG